MDPIADMLTQIRNAQAVRQRSCLIRLSKIKEEIIKILKEENYIRDYRIEEKNGKKNVRISLLYDKNGNPSMKSLKRTSKPGRRFYCSRGNLPIVLKGLGIAIISTSKGIMTDKRARKENVGGEIICEIY